VCLIFFTYAGVSGCVFMSMEVLYVRRVLEGQEISIHKYGIFLMHKKSVYIHHKKEWLPFHFLRNYNLCLQL
jgi:hypothetical protein